MISQPDDYGLTAEQTLAHRSGAVRPPDFDSFWAEVREAARAMPLSVQGSIDGTGEIVLRSLDDVRIVGQLHAPESEPRAVVVTTHGYATTTPTEGRAIDGWLERDMAVLCLRVRGFPPSTIDFDDLGVSWILHSIESAEQWVLRGAVIDVVTAVRAMRHHFGPDVPLVLHGESFGGGLAVLAGAQLFRLGEPPFRLILALPSLGDWRWRLGRYCNGAGGQINMLLEALRDDQEAVLRSLALFDATLHATDIDCPVFCKLALRDDTVPAPSAAAVFNALATPTARRGRFVTGFGHFDGGLSDARRHALFERLHPVFGDPGQDLVDFFRKSRTDLDIQQSTG
ncbi:MAG: acetylxylan esterase [Planctomycetota bacterium]|jgi:cephalosporin-C deacetylase-like acetyl esterase